MYSHDVRSLLYNLTRNAVKVNRQAGFYPREYYWKIFKLRGDRKIRNIYKVGLLFLQTLDCTSVADPIRIQPRLLQKVASKKDKNTLTIVHEDV